MEGSAAVSHTAESDVSARPGHRRGLPDLLYSDHETELRAAIRSLLEDRCAWRDVLARTETAEPYDTGLWRVLAADLGCAGLLLHEEHGGAGASYREAAVVAEELGRAVAPVPYLGSSVVATAAVLSAGDANLAAVLADGSVTAALAVPFTAAPGARPEVTVRLGAPTTDGAPGGYRLTGSISSVADALPADVLLVPVDGVPFGLYEVSAGDPGVSRTPVTSLDATRPLADIGFDDATGQLIASGEAAERAVAAALTAGAAVLAAEQLGVAERCLEMTVGYVKERRQFARPVGSFQALKHRLADLWVLITQARAASRYAAACLTTGDPDTPVAVALAKAACSDAAVLAGQECVQLHGGIGFAWDYPAHLYLKRAKSSSLGFGTADWHRGSLAGLVGLPAPAGRPR
jgi:alkylation response protein AidB-like acyl-CoA dehydrogenase